MNNFMFPAALGVTALLSVRQVFWLTPFPLAFPTYGSVTFHPQTLIVSGTLRENINNRLSQAGVGG